MCKITCSIKRYTPSENLTFYHAVRCAKFTSREDINIGKLKEIAESSQDGDWANSMYLAYKKEVAEGYIVPWEENNMVFDDEYYLIELRLRSDLNYVECSDDRFGNGTEENIMVSEADREFITGKLGKNTKSLSFMNYLGEKGYAFECYHDLDQAPNYNKELIVPSQLVTDEHFSIDCIHCYKVKRDGNKEESI